MDKTVKAGSVAVGICLLVIAVLLGGIVYFFYNANIEKNNLQAKINELETTIKEKDNKVNELENKISKVSDVVNSENETILTTYNGSEYTFEYNKNWKDLGIATKDSVGSVNRRIGALQLEIENKGRVSILKHSNITLSKYIEEHKKSYLDPAKENSSDGGFKLISEEAYNGNSLNGYKIVFEQMDLIYVAYLLESNNIVYEIEYPGYESNYTSIKSDLEKIVNTFKIN